MELDPLINALRKHFGWEDFRLGQRPVLDAILSGQDALVVLPTGGGKSLCYQLPALVKNGLVVVISPLIALMEDQVMQLQRRGIAAACLHASLGPLRRKEVLDWLTKDELRLLYIAPEGLNRLTIRQFLQEKCIAGKLVAIAVDEAHCISAWGHDFRPAYLKLGEVRRFCPGVPVVALSATAAPRVRADIIRLLELCKPLVQVCSGRRSNLNYIMKRRPSEPLQEVLTFLKDTRGATLIYARTRRSVEKWAKLLQAENIEAIPYHAGLNPEARAKALEGFLQKEKPVLVATVAFGMGVDRGDVGLVLHLNLPATPEGYLQESGRAGRDGLPASCLVLFSPKDRIRLAWAIKSSLNSQLNVDLSSVNLLRSEIAFEQLRRMEAVAEGECCREQALLLAIGEVSSPCGRCDRCLSGISRRDWSVQAETLLSELSPSEGVDISSLVNNLSNKKGQNNQPWGWLIRRLVQEELICESNDGLQRLYMRDSGRCFLNQPWRLDYLI